MPRYEMTLTMLSPVHIGSGEEIDPSRYVVRKELRGDDEFYFFYAIDLPRFLARIDDRKRREFIGAAEHAKGPIYLRKFLDQEVDVNQDALWKSDCNPDVFDHYQAALESDRSQLRVELMQRDPISGQPYIPGSSIKGAIRTALVNQEAAASRVQQQTGRMSDRDLEKRFEPIVLGYQTDRHADIRADPFRAIQVGDAPLCQDSNTIDPVTIYKPNREFGPDPAGIQMFYDVTFSQLHEETISATGRLLVNDCLARTPTRGLGRWDFDRCVTQEITAESLLAACNAFYRPRLEDELGRFPLVNEIAGATLREEVSKLGDGEALIRLGRFSHRECVTVSRKGGMPEVKGTTRSLACDDMPLGWARLSLKPMA